MWPVAGPIRTQRLTLEPLNREHTLEMVQVLSDPRLYTFTGGEAPTADALQRRYDAQSAGQSPDNSAGWLNWIVRESRSKHAVGYVQATVSHADADLVADVAWVIGTPFQGAGYATEAANAMLQWLAGHEVVHFAALIHPSNRASSAVALKLGFAPTPVVVDDEVRWEVQAAHGEAPPP